MTLRKLNQTKIGVNNFQRCLFVLFFFENHANATEFSLFSFILFNLISIPPLNPTAMCVCKLFSKFKLTERNCREFLFTLHFLPKQQQTKFSRNNLHFNSLKFLCPLSSGWKNIRCDSFLPAYPVISCKWVMSEKCQQLEHFRLFFPSKFQVFWGKLCRFSFFSCFDWRRKRRNSHI